MARTWLALGKLVVGNLDTIIKVSRPLLTHGSLPSASRVLNRQIEELQGASELHGAQIAQIASDLKEILALLDQAAVEASAERLRARVTSAFAIGVAVVALLLAVVAVFLHR